MFAKVNGEAGLGVVVSVVLAPPVPAEGEKVFGAERNGAALEVETSAALVSLGAIDGEKGLAVENNEVGC
jgi:hypothetical protein